jgi:capsid protein
LRKFPVMKIVKWIFSLFIRHAWSFQNQLYSVFRLEFWLPGMKKKFKFMENNSIQKQVVGVTCETCAVKDCLEISPIHF